MTPELLAAATRVIQANGMLQHFYEPGKAPLEPEERVMFDLDRRKALKELVAAEDAYNKLLDGVE